MQEETGIPGSGRPEGAESYPIVGPIERMAPRAGARFAGALVLSCAPFLFGSCQSTPVTGRSAFNLFSVDQDVGLGRESYAQILAGQTVVSSGPQAEMVERVMSRLIAVADDPGFEWEVTLIEDDRQVNAFALPGGKMAVYSGILPVCASEAGLAVVMGHEIAHVVARHGTQRVTESLVLDIGKTGLIAMLDAQNYSGIFDAAGTLLVELPFSRGDESEADHIGLVYMARAGYDPREAIQFWQRMDAQAGGGSPPEWLSTHPSHGTRIENLQEWLPEAMAEWQSR
jgi:predicted Zn-dependent protease